MSGFYIIKGNQKGFSSLKIDSNQSHYAKLKKESTRNDEVNKILSIGFNSLSDAVKKETADYLNIDEVELHRNADSILSEIFGNKLSENIDELMNRYGKSFYESSLKNPGIGVNLKQEVLDKPEIVNLTEEDFMDTIMYSKTKKGEKKQRQFLDIGNSIGILHENIIAKAISGKILGGGDNKTDITKKIKFNDIEIDVNLSLKVTSSGVYKVQSGTSLDKLIFSGPQEVRDTVSNIFFKKGQMSKIYAEETSNKFLDIKSKKTKNLYEIIDKLDIDSVNIIQEIKDKLASTQTPFKYNQDLVEKYLKGYLSFTNSILIGKVSKINETNSFNPKEDPRMKLLSLIVADPAFGGPLEKSKSNNDRVLFQIISVRNSKDNDKPFNTKVKFLYSVYSEMAKNTSLVQRILLKSFGDSESLLRGKVILSEGEKG